MSNIENFASANTARQFLQFLEGNGFKPDEYKRILELMQSVPKSMSLELKERGYDPFLLSSKTKYDELLREGIRGARGILTASGISIAQLLRVRELYFSRLQEQGIDISRYSPKIDDFDAIIGLQPNFDVRYTDLLKILCFYPEHAKNIGFIADINDENLKWYISFYKDLTDVQNQNGVYQHEFVCDTKGSELYCGMVAKRRR